MEQSGPNRPPGDRARSLRQRRSRGPLVVQLLVIIVTLAAAGLLGLPQGWVAAAGILLAGIVLALLVRVTYKRLEERVSYLRERQRAAEALVRERDLLRALMDNIPDTVYFKDAHSRFTRINAAQARLLGASSPEEAVGKSDRDFFPHELAARYHADEQAVLQSGQPLVGREEPVADRAGNKRWFSSTKVALRDREGNIAGLVGISRDITERTRAEERLRLDEARLTALLELGQMQEQGEGRVRDFALNSAVMLTRSEMGFLGFLNEDETVMTVHAWSETATQQCFIRDKAITFSIAESCLWGEAVRQRKPIIANDCARHHAWTKGYPEGHVPVVRYLGIPVFDGDRIVAVAAVANKADEYDEGDVRQLTLLMNGMWNWIRRRRAEVALRESEERHRAVFEQAADGIILVDPETGRFVGFNDRACENLGYTREEFGDLTLAGIEAVESAEEIRSHTDEILTHGSDLFETMHRTKDGQIRHVLVSSRAISPGDRPFCVSILHDITERKRAEEAAERAQQRLLEQQHRERERVEAELAKARDELVRSTRLAAIGQVSASIAHELRNPLGSLRNAAYYLKRHVLTHEPVAAEYLGIIEQEVIAADRIITNLLGMARAREPAKQAVDLGQVVREAFAAIKDAGGVQCRMSVDPAPFLVQADPHQLQQMLENLLKNAVQAMQGPGEVVVEATRDPDHDTILVRDSGPGVAAEVRESLFEPLVTTKPSGTGLGLAICRQIAEKHGGTVDLAAREGAGAAFRIRLPRR